MKFDVSAADDDISGQRLHLKGKDGKKKWLWNLNEMINPQIKGPVHVTSVWIRDLKTGSCFYNRMIKLIIENVLSV